MSKTSYGAVRFTGGRDRLYQPSREIEQMVSWQIRDQRKGELVGSPEHAAETCQLRKHNLLAGEARLFACIRAGLHAS